MEPYNSSLGPARFGALSNINSDNCNVEQKDKGNTKQLKYYTQNFFDKDIQLQRGVNWINGFGIPKDRIDIDTRNRQGALTNPNLCNILPSLPLPTTPGFTTGQGSVIVEDSLRLNNLRDSKQCIPVETEYYKRHFYIFDNMPIVPGKCVDNIAQRSHSLRGGVSTRRRN